MARNRNAFTGGTQTTPAPVSMAGRHNRGGGPGRGGGGNNRVPKGGLFGGKAGEAASNQDPANFFLGALRKTGAITGTGTPKDLFAQDRLVNDLMGRYQLGVADNQRLSAVDWLKQQYGTEWGGKKGKNFNPGTLNALGGGIDQQFQTNFANENPLTAAVSQFRNQGMLADNGNDAFADFTQRVLAPKYEQEWRARQAAGETDLNMDQFLAQQDPARAQRLFANRAPQYRQPSAYAPSGGRWSWWS